MLKLRFTGCLIGSALGDAIGNWYESSEHPEIEKVKGFSGRWSDDTHMMIGVAESLIENEGFNGEHMAFTFIKNYKQEPWRGYGSGPPQVFKWIESGVPWDKAAAKLFGGRGSYGNGAAMRVAPIGLFYHNNPKRLRTIAYRQSIITHTHELAKEGAALQAYAVALALKEDPTLRFDPAVFLKKLKDFTRNNVYIEKLHIISKLLGETNRLTLIREIGNDVAAHNSVPAAIYSFIRHPNSFEQSILFAISLGGDMDTIGAMTGAISGAYLGANHIPKVLKSNLEKGGFIENLAEQLYNVFRRKYLRKK
jgi:poly(ADP-ribose) glycohydrolase ARH3